MQREKAQTLAFASMKIEKVFALEGHLYPHFIKQTGVDLDLQTDG